MFFHKCSFIIYKYFYNNKVMTEEIKPNTNIDDKNKVDTNNKNKHPHISKCKAKLLKYNFKANAEEKFYGENAKLRITKNNFVYIIVSLSVYIAWFILSGVAPYFGYIPFGATFITYLSLIIVLMTCHLGIIGNIVGGFGFGLSSWCLAFIFGTVRYQHFDLAVLPRLCVALTIYLFYWATLFERKPAMWKYILIAIIGAMANDYYMLAAQQFHNKYIGELEGLLPPLEWIIAHPINLIGEPIICALLAAATYHLALYLRKITYQRQSLSW